MDFDPISKSANCESLFRDVDHKDDWKDITSTFLKTRRSYWSSLLIWKFFLVCMTIVFLINIYMLYPRSLHIHYNVSSTQAYTNFSGCLAEQVILNMTLTNPNFFAITLNSLDLRLLSSTIQFGNLTVDSDFDPLRLNTIPPREHLNLSYTLPAQWDTSSLVPNGTIPARYAYLFNELFPEMVMAILSGDVPFVLTGSVYYKVLHMPLSLKVQEEVYITMLNSSSKRDFESWLDGRISGGRKSRAGENICGSYADNPRQDLRLFVLNMATLGLMGSFVVLVLSLDYFVENVKVGNLIKKERKKKIELHQHLENRSNRPSETFLESYRIRFQDLSLKIGDRYILQGVSGTFKPGKLTAIMGPSGSGKTSMLSALSGRATYGVTSGDIFINEKKSSFSKYKKIAGFVPQEDIMIRSLTVEDILFHSAYTRLSSDTSREEIERIVEEVVELLGLEGIVHSEIGDEDKRGISGGQRKRVNIAMELVANPGMIFLDEPTSGLDAAASIEVCGVLHSLAQSGLTIVAVIHQPRAEIVELFDEVALLGFEGRPVYLGPLNRLHEYFFKFGVTCPARANPADFFLDLIAGKLDSTIKLDPFDSEEEFFAREDTVPTMCSRLQYRWKILGPEFSEENQEPIEELPPVRMNSPRRDQSGKYSSSGRSSLHHSSQSASHSGSGRYPSRQHSASKSLSSRSSTPTNSHSPSRSSSAQNYAETVPLLAGDLGRLNLSGDGPRNSTFLSEDNIPDLIASRQQQLIKNNSINDPTERTVEEPSDSQCSDSDVELMDAIYGSHFYEREEIVIMPVSEYHSVNLLDFLHGFFLAALIPITLFLILFHENRKLPLKFYRCVPLKLWFKHSFHFSYGLVFGTLSGLVWIFFVGFEFSLYAGTDFQSNPIFPIFMVLAAMALVPCAQVLVVYLYRIVVKAYVKPFYFIYFLAGFFPFGIPFVFFWGLSRRLLLAAASGFIFFVAGSIWPAFLWPVGFYVDGVNGTALLLIIAFMVVFYLMLATSFFVCAYRFYHVSSLERQTKGFFYQTWLFMFREFKVQLKNYKSLLFHISQVFGAGLFLGLIFYDRRYQGPFISAPLYKNQTLFPTPLSGTLCPTSTFNNKAIGGLCMAAELPVDDPIPAITSLSVLTIALCAASFAVSVFSEELTVFNRENSTGSSTTCYFLGKNIAQIPIALIAPAVFLMAFSGLVILKSGFWEIYLLLVITYLHFAGVGYVMSLVLPSGVTQLAAIFFTLIQMMFSGSNPTLLQLKNNKLLGFYLYIPTYISFVRWMNELIYWTEITNYTQNFAPMYFLYGYVIEDIPYCWILVLLMTFMLRILAYIILITKENA